MLGLGHGLALLTYVLGVCIISLPVPIQRIKLWGPTLVVDAILAEVGLASVSIADALVKWISLSIQEGLSSPFTYSPLALTTILAQLASLDGAIILLIGVLSSTVILAPVASALSSMLGSALYSISVSIIIWLIMQAISSVLPSIWMTIYVMGLVFLAIPLRLGRSLGTTLMSSSIVLAIGLPLAPSIAIWLEGWMGYQGALQPFQSLLSQVQSDPTKALNLLANLPLLAGNLLAAVIVALVIFPFAYLFILSLIIRNVSALLGGASTSPAFSYILSPSYQVGNSVRRELDA